MKIKAQFAIEYIIVSAFAMLILLGSLTVIYTQYSQTRSEAGDDQIDRVAREMATTAGKIYYMGEPAKATLELSFPDNIDNICIGGISSKPTPALQCSEKEIVFLTKKGGEIVHFVSNHILMDDIKKIKINKGLHIIVLKAQDNLKVCGLTVVGPTVTKTCFTSDAFSITPDSFLPCYGEVATLYECDVAACDEFGILCPAFLCTHPCHAPIPGILVSQ